MDDDDDDEVVRMDSASQMVDDDEGVCMERSYVGLRFCLNRERASASLRTVGVTKRDLGRSLVVATLGYGRDRHVPM